MGGARQLAMVLASGVENGGAIHESTGDRGRYRNIRIYRCRPDRTEHTVEQAFNGRDGLRLAIDGNFDVAVVDRMLPGLDGLSLVKTLRKNGIKTSVLFLTNLGGIDDRVEGLNAGGDDYLVKPFAFSELLARVNALGRRKTAPAAETMLRIGDLEMNSLIAPLRARVNQSSCSHGSLNCWSA